MERKTFVETVLETDIEEINNKETFDAMVTRFYKNTFVPEKDVARLMIALVKNFSAQQKIVNGEIVEWNFRSIFDVLLSRTPQGVFSTYSAFDLKEFELKTSYELSLFFKMHKIATNSLFPLSSFLTPWKNKDNHILFIDLLLSEGKSFWTELNVEPKLVTSENITNIEAEDILNSVYNCRELYTLITDYYQQDPSKKILDLLSKIEEEASELLFIGLINYFPCDTYVSKLLVHILTSYLFVKQSLFLVDYLAEKRRKLIVTMLTKIYSKKRLKIAHLVEISCKYGLRDEFLMITNQEFAYDYALVAGDMKVLDLKSWIITRTISDREHATNFFDYVVRKITTIEDCVSGFPVTSENMFCVLAALYKLARENLDEELLARVRTLTVVCEEFMCSIKASEKLSEDEKKQVIDLIKSYFENETNTEAFVQRLCVLHSENKKVQSFIVDYLANELKFISGYPENETGKHIEMLTCLIEAGVVEAKTVSSVLSLMESINKYKYIQRIKWYINNDTNAFESKDIFIGKFITDSEENITKAIGSLSMETTTELDKTLDATNKLNTKTQSDIIKTIVKDGNRRAFYEKLLEKKVLMEPYESEMCLLILEGIDSNEVCNSFLQFLYEKARLLLEGGASLVLNSASEELMKIGKVIGRLTLFNDIAIVEREFPLVRLLKNAIESERIEAAILFASRILRQTMKSKIFRPMNPWLITVLKLIAETYENELDFRLKFEIDALFQYFHLDISMFVKQGSVKEPVINIDGCSTLFNSPVVARIIKQAINFAIREVGCSTIERTMAICVRAAEQLLSRNNITSSKYEVRNFLQNIWIPMVRVSCDESLVHTMTNNIYTYLGLAGIDYVSMEEEIKRIIEFQVPLSIEVIEHAAISKSNTLTEMLYRSLPASNTPQKFFTFMLDDNFSEFNVSDLDFQQVSLREYEELAIELRILNSRITKKRNKMTSKECEKIKKELKEIISDVVDQKNTNKLVERTHNLISIVRSNSSVSFVCVYVSQKLVSAMFKYGDKADSLCEVLAMVVDAFPRAKKELVSWLTYVEDERKYNAAVIYCFIKNKFITARDFDQHFVKSVKSSVKDDVELRRSMQFVQDLIGLSIFGEYPIATPFDFIYSLELLSSQTDKEIKSFLTNVYAIMPTSNGTYMDMFKKSFAYYVRNKQRPGNCCTKMIRDSVAQSSMEELHNVLVENLKQIKDAIAKDMFYILEFHAIFLIEIFEKMATEPSNEVRIRDVVYSLAPLEVPEFTLHWMRIIREECLFDVLLTSDRIINDAFCAYELNSGDDYTSQINKELSVFLLVLCRERPKYVHKNVVAILERVICDDRRISVLSSLRTITCVKETKEAMPKTKAIPYPENGKYSKNIVSLLTKNASIESSDKGLEKFGSTAQLSQEVVDELTNSRSLMISTLIELLRKSPVDDIKTVCNGSLKNVYTLFDYLDEDAACEVVNLLFALLTYPCRLSYAACALLTYTLKTTSHVFVQELIVRNLFLCTRYSVLSWGVSYLAFLVTEQCSDRVEKIVEYHKVDFCMNKLRTIAESTL